MTTHNELKSFVEDLDGFDKQNPAINKFIEKLDEKFNIQPILDEFAWTEEYFAKLDNLLIDIGYCARDDLIEQIKKFLHNKIQNIFIMKYNKLFNAGIWNHFDFLFEQKRVNWNYLMRNPAAIDLIKDNPHMIDWQNLSENPAAIDIIKERYKNEGIVSWDYLSLNPAAIDILKENPDRIDWAFLSMNPGAIDMLKANPDEINRGCLLFNTAAIDMIKQEMNVGSSINWKYLSSNPAAIDILKQNINLISWDWLSENSAAIDLLACNLNKINWRLLSHNSAAIDILKKNLNRIDYDTLCENRYDYFAEKIAHFNGVGHFPRSHLEL